MCIPDMKWYVRVGSYLHTKELHWECRVVGCKNLMMSS